MSFETMQLEDAIAVWNTRANRWAAFSKEELKTLWPLNNEMVETEDQLTREIKSELARRERQKK